MKLGLRSLGRSEIYKYLILARFSEKINWDIQALCVRKLAFQKKKKKKRKRKKNDCNAPH